MYFGNIFKAKKGCPENPKRNQTSENDDAHDHVIKFHRNEGIIPSKPTNIVLHTNNILNHKKNYTSLHSIKCQQMQAIKEGDFYYLVPKSKKPPQNLEQSKFTL